MATATTDSEADLLRSSKHYRAFSEEMKEALQQFEKAKKWPDLVKYTQKLQKVLTKHSQFPILPMKLAFCKRMAQCLNPNLPSGVHIKALNTLASVLQRIGPERLAKDLSLYSMGIFPLFQYAAMKVKPVMLDIFEQFYLPLKMDLVPCLSGLLMSVLPGLEEEGGEMYDRVLKFVNDLQTQVGEPSIFYRGLWKAAIASPTVRNPAIVYLDKKLPPVNELVTQQKDYLPEAQTLVKAAIKECLNDEELLTQRATMELLLNHFPISSGIFEEWDDIAVLSVKLVLRKEIALNRRLYSWFLGSTTAEFEEYGKKVLISAMQQIFSNPPDTMESATHPFRIMKALLEKQEIGEAIIENVLISIFYSLHRFKEGHAHSRQLRLQVNTLLELVQPEIIWGGAISLFNDDKPDAIGVIDSLIDVLRCDEESQHLHLPNLLSNLLNGIENIGSKGDFELMYSCLSLARRVFGKFSGISTSSLTESQPEAGMSSRIEKLEGLYRALLSYQNVVANVYENYITPHFKRNILSHSTDALDETQEQRRKIGVLAIELLVSLFIYLPNVEQNGAENEKGTPPIWFNTLRDCAASSDPKISCTALTAFVELISVPNSGITNEQKESLDLEQYYKEAANRLWALLDSQFSSLHFQVTQVLHDLMKLSKRITTEIIASKLAVSDPIEKVEACKRFGIIWKLINDRTDANPLAGNVFLVIDTLSDTQPMVRLAGRTWLTECIPKAERVLEPLLKVLLDPNVVRVDNLYVAPFDTRRIVYVFNLFRDIIACDFIFIPNRPVKASSFTDLTVLHGQQEDHAKQGSQPEYAISPFPATTWIEYFLSATLRFTQGFVSPNVQGDEEFNSGVAIVQSTSASLLRYFLTKLPDKNMARSFAMALQVRIARTLHFAVASSDFVFQVQLLRLLKTVISLVEDIPGPKDPKFQSVIKVPLFIDTIASGLQQPLSGSVRYYWVEFIGTLIHYYASDLKVFVTPVSRCLCDIIFSIDNIYAFQLSREILVILDALSNILSACLLRSEKEQAFATPSQEKQGGLFGNMVRTVFLADEPQATLDPIVEIRKELLSSLPYILKVFIYIWSQDPQGEDEIANKFNMQDRVVKILDPIFVNFSSELIHGFCALIEEYRLHDSSKLNFALTTITEVFNAMDAISPSIVFNDCSAIVSSLLKIKYNKAADVELLFHEITVIDFAYQFLLKTILPESELSKAYGSLTNLLHAGMNSRSPNLYLLMIQLVHNFAKRTTPPSSDKRLRKEFVDTVYKLVDQCLKIAHDHSTTISKLSSEKNTTIDEKTVQRIRGLSLKTIHTLAEVVPNLYGVISEDKNSAIRTVISTVMNYLRDRSEHNLPWAGVSALFLLNLIEDGYSPKLFTREILGIFNDNNFFYMDFVALGRWCQIINFIMREKSVFNDLLKTLAKSLQSHASMVFVSKEQENLLRARNIKRLAFTLLAGEVDQYATSLPVIQEHLFDALKLSHAHSVYEQVFTCMRVLMIRFSPQRLASFWPVIICELMRIFGFGGRVASEANLILSACKFFDLAILTDSEQFKLYEWIFIRDYFEELKVPFVPFIDNIASMSSTECPIKLNIPVKNEKQPLILLRSIDGLEQLSSYLRHYSEATFTNLVTGGHAVQEILEAVIAADMIEFSNVKGFAKTPELIITERARKQLERIDNSLKIEALEDGISDDILLDVNESDELAVHPDELEDLPKEPPGDNPDDDDIPTESQE